ncbi:MAG TPA: STAS domain-containing protein [Candidatus Methylomirabilis sp.]|nr:STAS domain-containing protein [Candidatus Methylomirabilis sp.]
MLMLGWRALRYLRAFTQPVRLDLEKLPASSGNSLVTRLTGKLALETVHNFIEIMRPEPPAHLILDMSGVSFLDSAGVGALVSIFVSRRNAGKTLALAELTPQGNAVLQVAGLANLLPTYPTVESALKMQN